MKVVILRVAKGNVSWADEATAVYLNRIQRHWKVSEAKLKLAPKGEVKKRRKIESAQIKSFLGVRDRLILLEERGEQASTETLASWLEMAMNMGTQRLVFAIGGPFGHDESLHPQAWKKLGLSKMVLNHEVARVVLAEQLYRASTIIYGGQYHH